MSELDPGVITQNTDTYYGCIPMDKSNAIVAEGGAPATVDFQIRDTNGAPIDLSKFFDLTNPGGEQDANGMFVKFATADYFQVAQRAERANVIDAVTGRIQFELPEYVYNLPCIYVVHMAIGNKKTYAASGKPLYVAPNKGVVLVEWTPFIPHTENCSRMKHRVVPAVEDIRRKLDDFVGKNDLMDQVEYSADDIIASMVWPVRRFNETPPRLRNFNYSLMDFPYYEYWVLGTAADLLQKSVVHYARNKLISPTGGTKGDEKNRDKDYMQLALMYKDEFSQWVRIEKARLNNSMGQGWSTIRSEYSNLSTFR